MSEITEAADHLRRKRGHQRVSFNHVADHLVDFAERNPECTVAMADFAAFLAAVEDVEHDHAAEEDTGGIAEQG